MKSKHSKKNPYIIIRPSSIYIGKKRYENNKDTRELARANARKKDIPIYHSYSGRYIKYKYKKSKSPSSRTSNPFKFDTSYFD